MAWFNSKQRAPALSDIEVSKPLFFKSFIIVLETFKLKWIITLNWGNLFLPCKNPFPKWRGMRVVAIVILLLTAEASWKSRKSTTKAYWLVFCESNSHLVLYIHYKDFITYLVTYVSTLIEARTFFQLFQKLFLNKTLIWYVYYYGVF